MFMQNSEFTAQTPPLKLRGGISTSHSAHPDQHFHLVTPQDGGPHPIVMCMNGGGWTAGTHHGYLRVAMPIAARGMAAASVGYRKVDQAPWPCPLEDLVAAYDTLVEHAGEFHIDPTQIFAMGDSAGGHLALMLSTERPLKGVISSSGPTDVRHPVSTSLPKP